MRETGVAYLILNAGAALRASRDLLDDSMPFVARQLDTPPMVRHRLGAALHVDAFEVGVDELALVELGLDALPVRLDALVRAGGRVEADDFPCFGEAFLLLGRPLDARLACPGRPLLLLPFPRWSRRRLLLLFFINPLLLAVVELSSSMSPVRSILSSCD